MKLLRVIALLLCFHSLAHAQDFTISGTVMDTLNAVPLYRGSVVVMRTNDSGIISHTRTGPDGKFNITVPKEGKYVLRITFVSFADYLDVINVTKPKTDLGTIPLTTKEHLLAEFVITQQIAAIKIKGDTTEYMADSFKVKEGANVEDLLKRLPGISIDKNGKITAQGEAVQKILVDGEEFFSDDPKVVTQSLQANIVNKVQVFDKKSDQAEFTGIDDGQKTKTINLELKEDKKKGYFGKLDAGGGTDGYYQEQGMINQFKGKRQISAFAIASNTDKVGLGWQDNDKFGGGEGLTEVTDNGINMSGGSYDDFGGWSGTYSGEGLPRVFTGGVHFADRWDEDKDHISGNYRYGLQNVQIVGDNTTQSSLAGDTIRVNTEHKVQSSRVDRHGFDGFYEWKIDSNSSLRVLMNASTKHSLVSSQFHTTTYNLSPETGPMTINDRTLSGNTTDEHINADMLFRKKFKKKGRTISIDVKEAYDDTKGLGFLNSTIATPDSTGRYDTFHTDQEKTDTSRNLVFSAKTTYTEPLSKVAFLELDYAATVDNNTAKKFSYAKDPSGAYNTPVDSFSSNYKYNIFGNRAGLNFKFVYKNYNFSFGSDVSSTRYLQTDLLQSDLLHRDSTRTYNYPNVYPKASFVYKFGKQTSLRFNYEGNSKQPTINQIQPLAQNTDPLNITVGNPNLKQQFTNTLHVNFNDYKIITQSYFYVGMYFTSDINAISTSQTIQGPVSTTQYINVNGNYRTNWWAGYDFKLKKPAIGIGFSADGNQNHTNNIINGLKNTSDNVSYNFGPNFSYYKEDKYDFSFQPHASYDDNHSTISTYSTDYWAFNGDFNASAQLPKKFEAGTTANIMIRQKTIVFPDNNQVIKWNAYVSKKFGKGGQFILKAMVYDILNQNTGYTRTATGSTISQVNYNTIRRYGMLNLVWNFTHTPGVKQATDEKK